MTITDVQIKAVVGFDVGLSLSVRKHRVTTYTSGNELQGSPVHYGDFEDDRGARQALADGGFTNGEFGWRKGYTSAFISVITHYIDITDQPAAAQAIRDVMGSDNDE